MTTIFILLIINSFFLGRAWDDMPKRFRGEDLFFLLIPVLGFLLTIPLFWNFMDNKFHIRYRVKAYLTYVPPSDLEKLISNYKVTKNKFVGMVLKANGVDLKNIGNG